MGANANFNGGKENTFQSKYNFLTLVGDAAFQLDFFGRLRRATEASRAELLATDEARQTVILTLVSDVANDYFTLAANWTCNCKSHMKQSLRKRIRSS